MRLRARPEHWLPGLLVVATGLAWAGALDGAFVFDDRRILTEAALHTLAQPARLLADTSRPLLKLSLALDFAAWGRDPWGYHATNLAIHALAGLALFGVVRRSLLAPRLGERYSHSAPWLAACAALLWLLHPLCTQAVTYVIQRGESLMGLALLVTLYCSIRVAEGGRRLVWGSAAVLACALGMGTKEVMVVAPLLVWLHDRTFFAGSAVLALRRRAALYGGLAATWSIPFLWIGSDVLFHGEFARPDLPTATPLEYARTQPAVLLHYLRLAAWPSPLCFDYGWPPARTAAQILPPLLAIGALVAIGALLFRRGSGLGFLALCFFAILAPTSSLVPIQDLAVEHRMYLPLAALVTAAVVLADRMLAPLGRWRAPLGGALVLALALALGLATAARNRDYRDELRLWQTAAEAAPRNARAHYNVGTLLAARGRDAEAIAALRRALDLDPANAPAHYNLANALRRRGDGEEALEHYRSAIRLDPRHAGAHLNLANELAAQGDEEGALLHYRLALEISPGWASAHNNLGILLERMGRPGEAVEHYRAVLRLRPGSERAQRGLERALAAAAPAAR